MLVAARTRSRCSGSSQRQDQQPAAAAAAAAAAAISIPRQARGPLALTGACRARHCAYDALPACIPAPHKADAGLPPQYTASVRLLKLRGRSPAPHRRGRSPPIHPRATAPMGRRWDARGTSRGGPEGRRSGTPKQRSAAATSGNDSDSTQRQRQRQRTRPAGRNGKPTPMPPRGAWFMVTSEWFNGFG